MFQCILRLTTVLFIIFGLLSKNYTVNSHRETVDWGEIIEPINLSRDLIAARQSNDDKDDNSLCPKVRVGENVAQPWRHASLDVITSLPPFFIDEPVPLPKKEQVLPDCDDNSANVVIKILFNRDDPCVKKSGASILQISSRDQTDDAFQEFAL